LLLFVSAASARAAEGVAIAEADYEGRAQFKITTPGATYFYDRTGGAFSRLLDRDGRDWIAFHRETELAFPRSAAAGYRGLPDLVAKTDPADPGAGRPGFDSCASALAGPASIRTVSKTGRWAWTWTFTAATARLRMEKVSADVAYWFLYEGPVGGRWSPGTHYFGADTGGPRRDRPALKSQLFERWRWAYFGDSAVPRVLFAAQIQSDDLPDNLWYLGHENGGALDSGDGMVVFGFGRGKAGPQFREPRDFVIGFHEGAVTDAASHAAVRATVLRAAPELAAP
jgi:hypothetical protein